MGEPPNPPGAEVGGERALPGAGTMAPDTDRDPDQRLRAALEASTRTEASLTALMRAVEQVTTGVSGAQQANERLTVELATARELLADATQQRRQTEEALARLRAEWQRERQFMIDEQDRFLAGLLSEHEEALAALRREMHERRGQAGAPVPPAEKATLPGLPRAPQPEPELLELRAELGSLQMERQRSRELMRRVQAQRDEAQELADRLSRECQESKAEIERLSALLDAPLDTAGLGAPELRKEQRAIPGLRTRRTEPQHWAAADPAADAHQRATAPPLAEALEAALLASRKSSPPSLPAVEPDPTVESNMAGPPPTPLLRKHDPRRRAIGGYSVRPEEVQPERIAARPGSKPSRS
jgi:chromosome segregation ATPase